MDKVDISRFELPPAVLTQEMVEYFQNVYGVDLVQLSASEMQILIDYREHGGAAAIMNLLIRLQKRGEES